MFSKEIIPKQKKNNISNKKKKDDDGNDRKNKSRINTHEEKRR